MQVENIDEIVVGYRSRITQAAIIEAVLLGLMVADIYLQPIIGGYTSANAPLRMNIRNDQHLA
jgi:hypothetical protein